MNRIKEKLRAAFGAIASKLQNNKNMPEGLKQPLPWCLTFAALLCIIAVTATVFGHARGDVQAYTGIADGSSCVMEDDVAALYDDASDLTPVESAQSPQIARVSDDVHTSTQAGSSTAAPTASAAAAQASAAPTASATPNDDSTDEDGEDVWNDVTQYLSNEHEQSDGSPHVITTTPTPAPTAASTTATTEPATDDSTAPQISYTAYDNAVSQRIILFSASATDTASGSALTESSVVVSCNNTVCTPIYTKQNVMTYALQLASGANNVTVTATSAAGVSSTVTQSITYNPPAQETVIVSVEATTVGLGYLVAPTQMTLVAGQPVSYYVDKVLNDSGYTTVTTGSVENSYYLASVRKTGAFSSIQVPTDLAAKINSEPDAAYVASFNEQNHSADSLTELTITNQSGWMYSVNDVYYTVGMSLLTPSADDYIRVRYTLAFGRDIGGGIEGTNWDKEW